MRDGFGGEVVNLRALTQSDVLGTEKSFASITPPESSIDVEQGGIEGFCAFGAGYLAEHSSLLGVFWGLLEPLLNVKNVQSSL